MFRRSAIVGAIALIGCCVLATGNAGAAIGDCARAAALPDESTIAQTADAVLCLVNSERARRGVAALRASPELARSAEAHSRDMVARGYFSHVSPGGSNVCQRVRRAGYVADRRACRAGETIAWGTGELSTAAQLVSTFMHSPGHRRILLDRRYRDVGAGLALGVPVDGLGDGATLTLDFGRRR